MIRCDFCDARQPHDHLAWQPHDHLAWSTREGWTCCHQWRCRSLMTMQAPKPGWRTLRIVPPVSHQPMVRSDDPITSVCAAVLVSKTIGKIQLVVLRGYLSLGRMSAREAEQVIHGGYGFSTIRKRISELSKSGHLVDVGVDESGRTPITIWEISALGRDVLSGA